MTYELQVINAPSTQPKGSGLVTTILFAIIGAVAFDFLKGIIPNQIALVLIGIAIALFTGGAISDIGMSIAMIGIANIVSKDTASIVSEMNSS